MGACRPSFSSSSSTVIGGRDNLPHHRSMASATEWIELGVMERLREICLEAYDYFIGLKLSEVGVDCCITKAPCGGEKAGRSPVDRGKRGVKRSMAVDASGASRWAL